MRLRFLFEAGMFTEPVPMEQQVQQAFDMLYQLKNNFVVSSLFLEHVFPNADEVSSNQIGQAQAIKIAPMLWDKSNKPNMLRLIAQVLISAWKSSAHLLSGDWEQLDQELELSGKLFTGNAQVDQLTQQFTLMMRDTLLHSDNKWLQTMLSSDGLFELLFEFRKEHHSVIDPLCGSEMMFIETNEHRFFVRFAYFDRKLNKVVSVVNELTFEQLQQCVLMFKDHQDLPVCVFV